MTRFIHLALLTTAIGFSSMNIIAYDSDKKEKKDDDDDDKKDTPDLH
jgi:hypothetical protein